MHPRSTNELDFTPQNQVMPSPSDWRDQVIYHVLIDRFDNNAQDLKLIDSASQDKTPQDIENGSKFQGGRIAGITRRLDYIRGLGCTTVWISPPFKNRQHLDTTYHGYSIQNFLAIDPRFGTLDDLRELVRQAHERNMYVILDIVINHTGDNWGYENNEDKIYRNGERFSFGFWRGADGQPVQKPNEEFGEEDAVWPVEFQNPDFYKRQGKIGDPQSAEQAELQTGDLEQMKDLDLLRLDVRDALIRCYKWWIAQTDCDGFRIDTFKHCEPKATSTFMNALEEYAISIGKLNFLNFAEIVGEDSVLMKYIGLNTPQNPGGEDEEYPRLTACLDFPLHFMLAEVLTGKQPPQKLHERYQALQKHYRSYGRAGLYYVTFLDNHDQIGRPFYRFCFQDPDPRLATIGMGYLLTSMGIPCIYYGTEQCLNGGGEENDCHVRETMFGSNWSAFGIKEGHLFNDQHPAYQSIARIAQVRANEPTLRYGRQYFHAVAQDESSIKDYDEPGGIFAYSRILDSTSIVVAINVDLEMREARVLLDDKFFPVGANVQNLLTGQSLQTVEGFGTAVLPIQLQPREIAIYKRVS